MYTCANCVWKGCQVGDMEKTLPECPSKDTELQKQARDLSVTESNQKIAKGAAMVEWEGYGSLCRMEETLLFCRKMNYQKLGLIFCTGLWNEANVIGKVLSSHGFDVRSVICKNGSLPKATIGLSDQQTLTGCADEVMCNPIGQALTMNQEKVDFNILVGLCVGHDSLVLRYLDAPATVLAVKDRVTGHNPLASIYLAQGYYKKKFFK